LRRDSPPAATHRVPHVAPDGLALPWPTTRPRDSQDSASVQEYGVLMGSSDQRRAARPARAADAAVVHRQRSTKTSRRRRRLVRAVLSLRAAPPCARLGSACAAPSVPRKSLRAAPWTAVRPHTVWLLRAWNEPGVSGCGRSETAYSSLATAREKRGQATRTDVRVAFPRPQLERDQTEDVVAGETLASVGELVG
jgi:hypothetical protein